MTKKSISLSSLLLLSSLAPAYGQEQKSDPSPSKLEDKDSSIKPIPSAEKNDVNAPKKERIRVTGSRIRQLDLEGPKPIITVDRKDLEKSGAVNLNEALNKLTIASFGSSEYGSSNGAAEGTQSVNLRGLGEGNTLILLNGRRIARDPSLEFVDLSVIPTAAIEKIEIVTGTSSAIYGSDALAGVINIITRKDYEGFSFGTSLTKPRFKGGERHQAYALAGTQGPKSKNLLTMQWDESLPILAKDRYWNDTNYRSSRGTPFSYESTSGKFEPVAPCNSEKKSSLGTFCGYDYWDIYQIQGNWQKFSALDEFTYDLSDNTKLNLRLFATKKTAKTSDLPGVIDPSDKKPYSVAETTINSKHPGLANGANPPQYSADPSFNNLNGVAIQGRVPTAVSGTKTDQTTFSTSAGLVHTLSDDAELEFNVSDSRIYRTHIWSNFLDDDKFRKAVFYGDFDVLDPTPKGDITAYQLDIPDTSSGTSKTVDLNVSGSFEFVEKKIGYSVGAANIFEAYDNHAPANKLANQVKGLGGGGGQGERKANAVYAEINVPVTGSVETSIAARFDDYSDFGSTLNPMLGIQYRLGKSFFTRANIGTGFKAPTLRELHDEEARYFSSFTDYKLCNQAKASGIADDIVKYCDLERSAVISSGGNTKLDPQKSQSINFYLGYEPVIGRGINLEYFNQKIKNGIASVSADELLQLESEGRDLPKGTNVIRNAAGEVTEIVSPTVNLSTTRTSGITLKAFTGYETSIGRLSYKADYSYYLSYTRQKIPGGKFEQYLEEGGTPRWRWTNTLGYGLGDHNISLISNSNGRYQKSNKTKGFVGSYSNWDLNYAYLVSNSFDFELGGTNIFNQGFPFDDSDAISRGVGGAFYPAIGPTVYTRLNFHI